MSAIIPVDSLPAKELVEFWSHKYAEVKRELDQLKAQHQLARSSVVETRLEELLVAFKRESRWREEDEEKTRELVGRLLQDAQLSERLTTLERTNHELRQRLDVCENEREMLRKQATTMRNHSIALAVENHRWRCSMLARAGLTKRVDRSDSDYSLLAFTSPSTIVKHLPQQFSTRHR
ncbi:hypothetical protein CERSUDRAFT_86479 [Gelatoporia subvermispora B]|uniref:Uncharacterized protein n=1 Tax=Ceriporiopsis subvermispora (strain B) TaxID=914234 RepID=M2R7H5_CERS8|nr:hypothetical protein CERSUDRAFT_86479 [Gelatoporia subvermispora B]